MQYFNENSIISFQKLKESKLLSFILCIYIILKKLNNRFDFINFYSPYELCKQLQCERTFIYLHIHIHIHVLYISKYMRACVCVQCSYCMPAHLKLGAAAAVTHIPAWQVDLTKSQCGCHARLLLLVASQLELFAACSSQKWKEFVELCSRGEFFIFAIDFLFLLFLLLTFCLLARCIASLRFAATFAGSTEFARRQQQQHTTTNKILQNNCNLMKCCSQWSKSRKSKPARMCVCVRVLECVIVLVNVCCVPFAMHACACMCAQVVRMCDCSMWASV